jgi:hypothetical protein
MTTDNLTPNALRKREAQSRAEQLAEFILPLREAGKSLRQIAATLTAAGVPTVNGGAWGPKQVLDILRRIYMPADPDSAEPVDPLTLYDPLTVPGVYGDLSPRAKQPFYTGSSLHTPLGAKGETKRVDDLDPLAALPAEDILRPLSSALGTPSNGWL